MARKFPGGLVDERGLGSTERMSSIFLGFKTDCGHPVVNESGILPRADVVVRMDTANHRGLGGQSGNVVARRQKRALTPPFVGRVDTWSICYALLSQSF